MLKRRTRASVYSCIRSKRNQTSTLRFIFEFDSLTSLCCSSYDDGERVDHSDRRDPKELIMIRGN